MCFEHHSEKKKKTVAHVTFCIGNVKKAAITEH